MDLRGLGAFLSAIAGYFSAQAGAKAGQLQGLLMGEELTERRKRMKMTEEAHELQKKLAEAEEARRAELFPIQKGLLEHDLTRRQELFPYEKEALATQVEAGKLGLENTRLWSLYQRGVVPSQISDPVLRAQYEPFFNFQMAVRTLEVVRSQEELDRVLGQVDEALRPTLEIWGRASLLKNQMQQQMMERQLQGMDINLAQGDFQLRTLKLNYAINTIINNINSEGMDWDKRTPQQKIEAVKKWIKQLGLEDVVSEDFANMFQRVKSVDARQFALYRAQAELQYGFQSRLLGQQIAGNISLQDRAMWNNLVLGALGLFGGQGGGGNVAPVGFMNPAPPPNIFTATPDNQGSYLNQTALNNYLKPQMDVPIPYGNGVVMLGSLRGDVSAIYNKLGRPNADITPAEINTLITYDAGLQYASALKGNFPLDWNTALLLGAQNILPVLKGNHLYRSNPKYKKTVDDWERAWQQKLQQRSAPAGGGQGAAPQGGGRPPAPTTPTGQIGGQRPAPASPPAQPRGGQGGGQNYTSSARKKRQ